MRHEPCDDPNCGTCLTALKRGIDKQRPLYTSNSDHYILTPPGNWSLFDIEADPHQDNNIADEYPEIVKKMSDYYDAWWEKVGQAMTRKMEQSN